MTEQVLKYITRVSCSHINLTVIYCMEGNGKDLVSRVGDNRSVAFYRSEGKYITREILSCLPLGVKSHDNSCFHQI